MDDLRKIKVAPQEVTFATMKILTRQKEVAATKEGAFGDGPRGGCCVDPLQIIRSPAGTLRGRQFVEIVNSEEMKGDVQGRGLCILADTAFGKGVRAFCNLREIKLRWNDEERHGQLGTGKAYQFIRLRDFRSFQIKVQLVLKPSHARNQ